MGRPTQAGAPATFKSVDAGKLTSKFGEKVTLPVSPEKNRPLDFGSWLYATASLEQARRSSI